MAVTTTETTSSTTTTSATAEQRPTLPRSFQITEGLRAGREAGHAVALRASQVR